MMMVMMMAATTAATTAAAVGGGDNDGHFDISQDFPIHFSLHTFNLYHVP